MSRYKAYAEYKDSGVDFIGEIPIFWRALRGKFVFAEYAQRSTTGDETLLSVSEYYGVKPRGETIDEGDFLSRAESLVDYKKCEKNDLVMNIMLAWKRGLGVTKYNGIVSPAYSVFRFNNDANPDYMHYLLRTDLYTGHFKTRSTGVIDSRLRLYPDSFLDVSILLPSKVEQQKIANFLDHETAKIDTLIAKQQGLIKLLKEKRQAVISHAVTKGLNPNAPMRDSGVEWLGEVPSHWKASPIKWYANIKSGENLSANEIESTKDENFCYPVYGGNGILGYSKGCNLRNAAIVIGRVGALCGNVHKVKDFSWISDNALILNIDISVLNLDYISLCLGARDLNKLADKNAQPLITGTKVTNECVPIPPIDEQREIADRISAMMTQFQILSFNAEYGIALLQERRTALISAAVTGKIDVRDWQEPRQPIDADLLVECV